MTRSWNFRSSVWLTLFSVAAVAANANVADAADGMAAERLIASAAKAEIAGDAAGRVAILQSAIKADPTHRQARWHLGQIEIDGQWQTVEAAQRAAAANPRQREYAALRSGYGDTPEGQLGLARWCDKNGLKEEARFHWMSVLTLEPNFVEALRALDAEWFQGRLLTREQIARIKEEQRLFDQSQRGWRTRLAVWERLLAGELPERVQALNEIRKIDDPAAIPVVQKLTLGRRETSDLELVRQRQVSYAFVAAIDDMSGPEAVASLVRHAVLSPNNGIRSLSIERLKGRPMYEYVPTLLDSLSAPLESWFGIVTGPDGAVYYHHAFYREGPFADWSATNSHLGVRAIGLNELALRTESPDTVSPAERARNEQIVLGNASRAAARFHFGFSNRASAAEKSVAQLNTATIRANELVVPVLAQTTGQSFGPTARDWWNWWQDYTEYDRSQNRPVYAQSSFTCQISRVTSCFAMGTPVWTKLGLRPIESLRIGDFVLSKNVDTGELTYKAVIGTTIRPPSPMVSIAAGSEQISATRGHPFWVGGEGWYMAKQLSEGAILHGVKEPVRVSATDTTENAEAFNLIVADFNTYFIGRSGMLVHDNTPVRATAAIVPGVIIKED